MPLFLSSPLPCIRQSTRSAERPAERSTRRPGNVSLYFLVFMGLTVPTMFWTINIWRIAEGKISQQRVCDASAHAALAKLTEEFLDAMPADPDVTYFSHLLYGDPNEIQQLCQTHATQEAINYAGDPTPSTLFSNYVDGAPFDYEVNGDNDEDDIQYGYYDFSAATPTFTPIDPATASVDERRTINAVRVVGIRSVERGNSIPLFGPAWTGYTNAQVVTRATAVLDRRVIGFRLHASANPDSVTGKLGYQTIPLAPVAILNSMAASNSWYNKVEKPDIDTPSSTRRNYGTIQINIPLAATYNPPTLADAQNAKLINIGSLADYNALATQVTGGVTADDEDDYTTARGHGLILDETTYDLPAAPMAPSTAMNLATDVTTLSQAFQTLMTDRTERAWPIADALPASGDITVTGFVAARILKVETIADGDGNNYIRLTLQPTLLQTPTAYTDYSGRFLKQADPENPYDNDDQSYSRLINPYIGRIRLVE